MTLEFIIGGLALMVTIVGVGYQIKVSNKTYKRFNGRIGIDINDGKDTKKFIDFIYKNEGKLIHINIYLDDNVEHEIDTDKMFRFSIPEYINEEICGGNLYAIKVENNDDFFYDNRFSSKRLVGYFKILGVSGPNQGWITSLLKPVNIDSIK